MLQQIPFTPRPPPPPPPPPPHSPPPLWLLLLALSCQNTEDYAKYGLLKSRFYGTQTDKSGHSSVLCSVTRPLNESEAKVGLVLIQTSLLFFCKSCCCNADENKSREVCIKARSTPVSLLFKGLVTEHRSVK